MGLKMLNYHFGNKMALMVISMTYLRVHTKVLITKCILRVLDGEIEHLIF